ncbi:MAG: PIG-L family deacetylase [Bryobacter sp.]|jgi:bacillithiol biosynthesis deacetylase BshB1|nr:PIG-L family deacetylase [Bryobacter sp. CoA8 C33]
MRLASHYLDNIPEVDVAVLLPHPGDAEIFCGGAIAKLAAAGHRVGLLDFTAGEAGSHTRLEVKLDEADAAARILGVTWRGCLRFPDARLEDTIMSRMTVTGEIKRLRPRLLITADPAQGHPDALPAARLVENAVYLAGLERLDNYLSPHRGARLLQVCAPATAPNRIVDITGTFEQKRAALAAYTTLFADSAPALERLEREARRLGDLAGVRYGEAFLDKHPLVGDLL